MYPYERYYKELKSFIRNLAKPEGSIAHGYQMEEALGFVTEYMSAYTPTRIRAWDSNEQQSMIDEVPEGKTKAQVLFEDL